MTFQSAQFFSWKLQFEEKAIFTFKNFQTAELGNISKIINFKHWSNHATTRRCTTQYGYCTIFQFLEPSSSVIRAAFDFGLLNQMTHLYTIGSRYPKTWF